MAHLSLFVNVPITLHALPHCSATDSRWRRNMVDLGSCVTAAMQRPNLVISSKAYSSNLRRLNGEWSEVDAQTISEYLWPFYSSDSASETIFEYLRIFGRRRWLRLTTVGLNIRLGVCIIYFYVWLFFGWKNLENVAIVSNHCLLKSRWCSKQKRKLIECAKFAWCSLNYYLMKLVDGMLAYVELQHSNVKKLYCAYNL